MFIHRSTTVFVDNLPDQIRKIWVYNLFSKYGKIRDVFIPIKKSKISGKSFGFVRFFRITDAEKAIADVKDSWYWGHKLVVNFARFLRAQDEQGFQRNFGSVKSDNWKENPRNQSYGNLRENPQFLSKGKDTRVQQSLQARNGAKNNRKSPYESRGKEIWRRKGTAESSKQGEQRNINFTTVSTGVLPKSTKGSVTVQPIGNGWLMRSAIAKIKRLVSTEDLELVFKWEEAQIVQIKPIGGRYVIIVFPNEMARDSVMKERWISNWFEEIKQWDGDQANEERFVWLSCYGMPLHAWSLSTFRDIGNMWGQFLQVDDATLKESSFVKARILIATNQINKLDGSIDLVIDKVTYSVRVIEEETFRFVNHSFFNILAELALDKLIAVDEQYEDRASLGEKMTDVGAKTDVEAKHGVQSDVGNNEVEKSKINQGEVDVLLNNEVVEGIDSRTSSLEMENSVAGNEVVLDSFGGSFMENQPLINPANGLENQEDGISSGMFIEDSNKELEFADEDLVCNENTINEDELNLDHFDANNIPIQAAIKGIKGKSKRKNINEILGYSKVNKGNTRGRRSKNKCVVLRSAVASAALSASISSGGINNRNRILLDEAKAIWEVDKLFGIRYDGEEEEVISKIAEMEALNKVRADVC